MSRRDQLLDATLGYCVKHGLANLSLRPLADEIGTSARLLIFHFKSKENLIGAVLAELNKRLQTSFVEVAAKGSLSAHPPLRRFWDWATSEEVLPCLRLLYELQIMAAQKPEQYGRYLEKASLDWLSVAAASLSSKDSQDALATLRIAVFDGLMLELISTGDHARLTRALDTFVAMARASVMSDAIDHGEL